MQQDFHFYCIGVIAKAAGFSKKEALTIAYSSQYTDDSTESEPIRVGEMLFDPVRTAHKGIKAFEWSVQKRVFLAFHFIPAKPIETPQDTFCTMSNSEFAQMILHRACKERSKRLRPYRIGIALHTFADCWAHQYFSGREQARGGDRTASRLRHRQAELPGRRGAYLRRKSDRDAALHGARTDPRQKTRRAGRSLCSRSCAVPDVRGQAALQRPDRA